MLSVLIPNYNWKVYPLVKDLHKQLTEASILFELHVVDDASPRHLEDLNIISDLSNTYFESLENNIGRSSIRNYLARKAKYSWLLFLDCDVSIKPGFIKTYLELIDENSKHIITGGICYNKDSKNKGLHYKFGVEREMASLDLRKEQDEHYFFTSNFLIPKEVFYSVNFDEDISMYGYEDLLFAKTFKYNGGVIKPIDNAVYHLGLDNDELFIDKTKESLLNLKILIENEKIHFSDTKLTRVYKRFYYLVYFLSAFVNVFERLAVKKTSLFYYDLFRLTYLSKMFKK